MKKMFSLVLVASLFATACTKQSHGLDDLIPHQQGVEDKPHGGGNAITIPTAVSSAFKTRFPDATRIEWKQLSDGSFKAEFFRGSVKWEATFNAAGTLIKVEHN